MSHRYGYKPDKQDNRDFLYRATRPLLVFPSAVDLRSTDSPVRDQGDLGSCTGFATATGMREFLQNVAKEPFVAMSPLFLYYQERALEGTIPWDDGAELRDGMKVLVNMGCAPESDWPYNISKFAKPPTAMAIKNALNYTVASYHRLNDLADAKDCLAQGGGFTIGFYVYTSFESIGSDGKMPMPAGNERILGGHAVFVVGYKDDASWPGGGYLIVKNSWGKDWGDKGYFYMPYAFYDSNNVPDVWVAVGNTAPVPPITPTPPAWLKALIAMLEEFINWLKSLEI